MALGKKGDAAPQVEANDWVASDQWKRVHWITPLADAWKTITFLFVFALINFGRDIFSPTALQAAGSASSAVWGTMLAVIGGLLLLLLGYTFIAWRYTSYAITDDAVHFKHGILAKQERQIKLSRLQAVDIRRPLLGRLFGLGGLNVEAAGGANSNVYIRYLNEAELEPLRAQILALAAGIQYGDQPQDATAADPQIASAAAEADAPLDAQAVPSRAARRAVAPGRPRAAAPVAPEVPVYELPSGLLLKSVLLTLPTILVILIIVTLIATAIWAVSTGGTAFAIAIAGGIGYGGFVFIITMVGLVWQRINRDFGLRTSVSPDGIRINSGLTQTRHFTIPPGRIHALQLHQPLLWRFFDLWDLKLQVASYGGSREKGNESNGSVTIAPAATREQALSCAWLVLRDMGVEDPQQLWEEALDGTRKNPGRFTVAPRISQVFNWLTYRRNAYFLAPQALLIRHGWINKRVNAYLLEHIQSVSQYQGPVARAMKLADMRLHMVNRSVMNIVENFSEADIASLQPLVSQASQQRRAQETPGNWMAAAQAVSRHNLPGEMPVTTPKQQSDLPDSGERF